MKKLIIAVASIASLVLIVVALTAGTLGATNQKNQPKANLVHYAVAVNMQGSTPICGNYLVVVLDGSGTQSAPAQSFIPGVKDYHFYELGPVINGVRIARLVTDPGIDNVCRNPLVTPPDAIYSDFYNGMTYNFNLYPGNQGLED
jgi:hypothetical protein